MRRKLEFEQAVGLLFRGTPAFLFKANEAIEDIRLCLTAPAPPPGFKSKRDYALFRWRDAQQEFNEPRGAMEDILAALQAIPD